MKTLEGSGSTATRAIGRAVAAPKILVATMAGGRWRRWRSLLATRWGGDVATVQEGVGGQNTVVVGSRK